MKEVEDSSIESGQSGRYRDMRHLTREQYDCICSAKQEEEGYYDTENFFGGDLVKKIEFEEIKPYHLKKNDKADSVVKEELARLRKKLAIMQADSYYHDALIDFYGEVFASEGDIPDIDSISDGQLIELCKAHVKKCEQRQSEINRLIGERFDDLISQFKLGSLVVKYFFSGSSDKTFLKLAKTNLGWVEAVEKHVVEPISLILKEKGAIHFSLMDQLLLSSKEKNLAGFYSPSFKRLHILSNVSERHQKKVCIHELIHCLAGVTILGFKDTPNPPFSDFYSDYKSWCRDFDSSTLDDEDDDVAFEENFNRYSRIINKPIIQRLGLRFPFSVIQNLRQQENTKSRFRWLNEAVTEKLMWSFIEPFTLLITPDQFSQYLINYKFELQILDKLIEGLTIYSDSQNLQLDVVKLICDAYFEDFDPLKPHGQRCPKVREFLRLVSKAFGTGFLVQLDDVIKSDGGYDAKKGLEYINEAVERMKK